MARNYIQPGGAVTVPAPTGGMVSGTPYLLGAAGAGKVVIALQTKAQTVECECATTGVYEVPKAAPLVINIGDTLYWDNTAKNVNKTSASNTVAGWAFKAAASNDTTVQIKLAP